MEKVSVWIVVLLMVNTFVYAAGKKHKEREGKAFGGEVWNGMGPGHTRIQEYTRRRLVPNNAFAPPRNGYSPVGPPRIGYPPVGPSRIGYPTVGYPRPGPPRIGHLPGGFTDLRRPLGPTNGHYHY